MKAFKTEIKPTKEQQTIVRTIGTCRFVYNAYLHHVSEIYKSEKKFVSAFDFRKYLVNDFLPNNTEYSWIKEVSSKAVMKSILNAETAFKNFFNKKSKFPKFKKKKDNNVKFYFVKTGANRTINCERHRIKLPTLGFVRIKEKGYLPTTQVIKSGTISKEANRYYCSVLVDSSMVNKVNNSTEGIGINKFVTTSNNEIYNNINKTKRVKDLNKKLKREQRSLSRKYEVSKISKVRSKNFEKNLIRVQKVHCTLKQVRKDYVNKVVNDLTKTKLNQQLKFITIENLNIKGMLKNRCLSKAISGMNFFFFFKTRLLSKCIENNIELREVDRFFPSSKLCSSCGNKKEDLKLKDRTYKCIYCNLEIDRDLNASINLRNCKEYKVLTELNIKEVPVACRELTTVEC